MHHKNNAQPKQNGAIGIIPEDVLILLHTSQVARILGVESETVRRLVVQGDLKVYSWTAGRHARYRLQDVLAFKATLAGYR
jgi:excisionase family DNA binding protein